MSSENRKEALDFAMRSCSIFNYKTFDDLLKDAEKVERYLDNTGPKVLESNLKKFTFFLEESHEDDSIILKVYYYGAEVLSERFSRARLLEAVFGNPTNGPYYK